MKLFDTHAHYADEKFDLDRDTLIPSLYEQGIDKIVEIACDVRTAQKSIDIIDKYPFVDLFLDLNSIETVSLLSKTI